MNKKNYIFGIHAVSSLLMSSPARIRDLYVLDDKKNKKLSAFAKQAKQLGIIVRTYSRHELDKLSDNANHQGIIAFCTDLKTYSEIDLPALIDNLPQPYFFLILDAVQDPHNLGACFRSAEAAGVQLIIAPKDKAVGITPVVSKVASGAVELLPFVQVTNLARTLEILKEKGVWIYGAAADAPESAFQVKFSGSIAMVLGAEGMGLRRLTKDTCDVLVKIPMIGKTSSLNVSVATGILLFEVLRQRAQQR